MKILKASNKNGQNIIWSANRCDGYTLDDIYSSWSSAKQRAYNECYSWYENDKNSSDFRVGNANTFSFSATWLLEYNGERALRYETSTNSYIVLLDK